MNLLEWWPKSNYRFILTAMSTTCHLIQLFDRYIGKPPTLAGCYIKSLPLYIVTTLCIELSQLLYTVFRIISMKAKMKSQIGTSVSILKRAACACLIENLCKFKQFFGKFSEFIHCALCFSKQKHFFPFMSVVINTNKCVINDNGLKLKPFMANMKLFNIFQHSMQQEEKKKNFFEIIN